MIAVRKHHYLLLALVLLLIFAALLRTQYIVSFVEWPDEIRSVWRANSSLTNLLIRTPGDWPPLYGIIVWGWMKVAGPSLEASRFLSILFSLVGLAFIYRVSLSLNRGILRGSESQIAAILSTAVFAALGYLIFAGVDVRAYGMLLTLGALAFWLTLRWLNKPSWRKAAGLAILLAIMFYSSFTSALFIVYLTLFIVVMRPRLFLQWVAIGIGVLILTIPIIPQFIKNGPGRVTSRLLQVPLPFGEAMLKIYQDFGGSIVFVGLLVIAGLLLLWRLVKFPTERRYILLLMLWILFPIGVYFVTRNQEFMKPRYMWWVAVGLALFIGYAAIRLPRPVQWIAIAAFVILPVIPVDFFAYRLAITTSPPFRDSFSWFVKNLRPGDVLVIDPNCTCGDQFAWDYFLPQYFPTGYLPIANHPGSASRVWYLSTTGWPRDEALLSEVEKGRKPSIFVGPWFFLLRLYEGPPAWDGARFDDKILLNGVEIENNRMYMAKGDSFRVKLWWSTQQPLDRDYSTSLQILDESGKLIAQTDGPPKATDTPTQTSAWKPGVYYEDFRDLKLPPTLDDGDYRLVVTVYQPEDGTRLKPEDTPLWERTGPDNSFYILKHIRVVS
ncbi:MAG: glycosyltransferase family 39 protein [Chloroflexota bacterium]